MSPRLRTRVREVNPSVHWTRTVRRPDGSVDSVSQGTGNLRTYIEEIRDVTGASDRVHPVVHNTVSAVPQPRPSLVHQPSGWSESSTNYYADWTPAAVVEMLSDLAHVDMGALSDNAFEALVPQIPQEVSLPNFLYELREITALLPSLQEGIVKSAAGGYLNYSFGWKPFIGDIQKLRSLMTTIRARLEYLRETWGKETRISYMEKIEVDSLSDELISGLRWTVQGAGIFRCGGYLYHKLENLDGLIGEYRALTGALGFNNPLAVVWEAIPFSFVVDWFSRVGSLISRTPIQPFVGPWELRRMTHSVSLSYTWSAREVMPSGYSPSDWKVYQDGKATLYFRDIGLPVSSSIFYEDGLSPQQQLLGAALLAGAGR